MPLGLYFDQPRWRRVPLAVPVAVTPARARVEQARFPEFIVRRACSCGMMVAAGKTHHH